MIQNKNYYDPDIFQKEIELIFRSGWQFVAMQDELAENRDFVCINLPDDSIVVQNFRGELKAFQNICSHRLNIIQTTERGNRPLTCGYHGWTFNSEGMPLGVGERQGFLRPSDNRTKLCLKQYRTETCGRFVFVSRDEDAISLNEFLGPFAPILQNLSENIGAETYFGNVHHMANWKLLVENVLECYHCATVHPETFISGLGVGRKPISDVCISDVTDGGAHSSSHFPRSPIKREALRKKIISHLNNRNFAHDSFFHIHIFPNLFISSTEGTNFYIGHALPCGPTETLLRVRFFEPSVELNEGGRMRQDAINRQSVPLGLQVINEDLSVLETLQRGVRVANRPYFLGEEEIRISAFHRGYQRTMSPISENAASNLL